MYESMMSFPGGLYGQFDRLRRELDGVFGAAGLPSSIRAVAPGTFPAINVGSTPRSVEVYAFAPGLDAQKIDVTLDRKVLTLSGERAPEVGEPGGEQPLSVYSKERLHGRFKRAVSLPDDVDPAQVTASYRDGVLRVSVARREAVQPQRIAVQ
ncbi:MAG: Hsp20/alpha crystallin family protein [Pseudomonadota bacterium]